MSHRTSHSRKSEQTYWRRQREQREVDDAARRRNRHERERRPSGHRRHTGGSRTETPLSTLR